MKKVAFILFTITTSISISLAVINQSRISILAALIFAFAAASMYFASLAKDEKKPNKSKVLNTVMIGLGVLILAYLWGTLRRRGVIADETGTAGYTHWYEILNGLLGVALVFTGLIRSYARMSGKKHSK
jgi:hypothetical protein